LDDACAVLQPPSDDVLAIHEALGELEARDPLKAQIVLLRYFIGLSMDETAAILGLAQRTLDRHWRYIRAWLMKRLSEAEIGPTMPEPSPEAVEALFQQALDQPLERRAAFLDEHCAGDPDLRAAVEELLHFDAKAQSAPDFLHSPLADVR